MNNINLSCVDLQRQSDDALMLTIQQLTVCVGATGSMQTHLRTAASSPRCTALAMSIPHGDKSIIFIRT